MNTLIAVLLSPFKILRWLFKHNPLITLIELVVLSAIQAFVIIPVISFFAERGDVPTAYAIGFGTFLGFLSVIFSSQMLNDRRDLAVNDYDVLALSVKDYLMSRGRGLLGAYVMAASLALILFVVMIPIIIAQVLYFTIFK